MINLITHLIVCSIFISIGTFCILVDISSIRYYIKHYKDSDDAFLIFKNICSIILYLTGMYCLINIFKS